MIWLCDVKYSVKIFDFVSEWRSIFDHRNLNLPWTQIQAIRVISWWKCVTKCHKHDVMVQIGYKPDWNQIPTVFRRFLKKNPWPQALLQLLNRSQLNLNMLTSLLSQTVTRRERFRTPMPNCVCTSSQTLCQQRLYTPYQWCLLSTSDFLGRTESQAYLFHLSLSHLWWDWLLQLPWTLPILRNLELRMLKMSFRLVVLIVILLTSDLPYVIRMLH